MGDADAVGVDIGADERTATLGGGAGGSPATEERVTDDIAGGSDALKELIEFSHTLAPLVVPFLFPTAVRDIVERGAPVPWWLGIPEHRFPAVHRNATCHVLRALLHQETNRPLEAECLLGECCEDFREPEMARHRQKRATGFECMDSERSEGCPKR